MESSKLLCLALVLAALGPLFTSAAPGIFDVFNWGPDKISDGKASPSVKSADGPRSDRRCVCDGSWCRCCVDLSLAGYIDIGGPGCIDMRYISQADGVKMNISYGDSLLHGAQAKVGNAVPVCMDILSDLAQVCASMKNLRNEGDGLYGCASLEPTLLGDPQEDYSFGCFKMGAAGILPDPENVTTTEAAEQEEEEEEEGTTEQASESSTTKPGAVNEEALISIINESAEDGIAWFTGVLGDIFGGNKGIAAPPSSADTAVLSSSPSPSPSPLSPSPSVAPAQEPLQSPEIPQVSSSVPQQQRMLASEIP